MADVPTAIDLRSHRDLEGRGEEVWVRRALIILLGILPVLGLLNFFGQHPSSSSVSSPVATLSVESPTRLRGGLIYQARFRIIPYQDINNAMLVLDRKWLEGMTVNTIEPSPSSESSDRGRLVLSLGSIKAGHAWNEYLEFQVNPTTIGHRAGAVSLYDGTKPLLFLTRSATVYP